MRKDEKSGSRPDRPLLSCMIPVLASCAIANSRRIPDRPRGNAATWRPSTGSVAARGRSRTRPGSSMPAWTAFHSRPDRSDGRGFGLPAAFGNGVTIRAVSVSGRTAGGAAARRCPWRNRGRSASRSPAGRRAWRARRPAGRPGSHGPAGHWPRCRARGPAPGIRAKNAARAVIVIGRTRSAAALRIAWVGVSPSCRRSSWA